MKKREELKKIRNLSRKQLLKELQNQYGQFRELQFSLKFRKLKNLKKINQTRKNIARIWTVLQEELSIRVDQRYPRKDV